MLLILSPRFTEDSNMLRHAAMEAGWRVERLPSWRVPTALLARVADGSVQREDIVLYAESLFVATVTEALDLAPLEPRFDWLAGLPEKWRKRDVRFGTLAEARTVDHLSFIKPADDKCFAAAIYSSGAQLPSEDKLLSDTPVLISEPVHFTVEYRLFVAQRRIATFSPYWRNGVLAQAGDGSWPAPEVEDATNFGQSVLDDPSVAFPPAAVLDVGFIEDRGWAVIESNAAWASGLYGCDPAAVLTVLRHATVVRANVTEVQRPWVLQRGPAGLVDES